MRVIRCNPQQSVTLHCLPTECAKKRGHRLMTTILSNLNRFAIFFTGRFLGKFAVKCVLKIPPHLVYVATLPCETLLSAKQAVNDKLQSSVAAYLHLHCIMMQQDRALISRNLERQGWFIYSSTKQLPIHTKKDYCIVTFASLYLYTQEATEAN